MRFFFSSRRRHTRLQGDWSSDVCSSDLTVRYALVIAMTDASAPVPANQVPLVVDLDRSEERRVGKSVDLGGRRIIKKKKNKNRQGSDSPQKAARQFRTTADRVRRVAELI